MDSDYLVYNFILDHEARGAFNADANANSDELKPAGAGADAVADADADAACARVLIVNGVPSVTWGHGLAGPLVGHEFFGTEKVRYDMTFNCATSAYGPNTVAPSWSMLLVTVC